MFRFMFSLNYNYVSISGDYTSQSKCYKKGVSFYKKIKDTTVLCRQ